jgi:UDP-N-acetylmuramoylalanine--D-glutamate ligase
VKNIDDSYRNLKVVVMGLGVNQGGLGVSKWLLQHGARLLVTDLKDAVALKSSVAKLNAEQQRLKAPPVTYVLGEHREQDFRGVDVVIQNPGVPRESKYLQIARESGARIETDISIFFRLSPHPVTAVTGTRGKTTTALLATAMLKEQFGRVIVGGNLRKSVLDELDRLMTVKKAPPIVFELSSWHLESLPSVKRGPHVAAITNLMPDHLNRYGGLKDYAKAKENIFRFQNREDWAIVPLHDKWTKPMGERAPAKRVWASMKWRVGEENFLAFRNDRAVIRIDGRTTELFSVSDLKLPGEHNLWDALIAAGLAFLSGAKPPAIRRAVRDFKGVSHRLEFVRDYKGVSYWNDSAATSPDGSVAALKALGKKKNIILITGGADKNLEFPEWAKVVRRHVKNVVLIDGTATPKIIMALNDEGVRTSDPVRSIGEVLTQAQAHAQKGDVILLSPGCASFGVFINEFDRGDQFRNAVKKLETSKTK